jgi:fatty-acyl-CoA synthase
MYPSEPDTLPRELLHAADSGGRPHVFHLQEGDVEITLPELVVDARRGAELLRSWGVTPGDTVGILGPNRPEWMRWAFATWTAGAAVVPLGFPLRVRDPDSVARHIVRLVEAAECRVVMADPMFMPFFPPEAHGIAWDTPLSRHEPDTFDDTGVNVDDPAVIQFTSGSTSSPKGVVLPHRQVWHQARGLDRYYGFDPETDRFVSWLPLFHDNGLFLHLVTPMLLRGENHIIPTERFAQNPALWFRIATEVRATVTSGPPSGWAAALKSTLRNPANVDLSAMEIGVLTAEMIQPEVADRLNDEGPTLRLRPEVLTAGYGMAEATLAVAISPRGKGLQFDDVDAGELSAGRAIAASAEGRTKRVAACGPPMPGMSIRIWDEDGEAPAPDRRVGEVQLNGPCVMRGYLGDRVEQPFTADGWLRTGDLGYLVDGWLHITGRVKDIVIVAGRNYAPEDIEWAVGSVPGVRAGRCVAFAPAGVDGEVIIAVEPARDADPAALPALVRNAVLDELGISVRDVVVVAKGSIPTTTSGKLQRSAVREGYARGDLQVAETAAR